MYALIANEIVAKYPYSVDQLVRDNPQTSFPTNPTDKLLESYGVVLVGQADKPVVDPATHKIVEGTPIRRQAGNGGVEWQQVWNVVPLTTDEAQQYLQNLQNNIVAQTQRRLDDFARSRNYDGILSLCTYATSTVPKFQVEGQYGVTSRDATWNKLYEMLAEVQAGTRPVPTGYADVEPELPALVWPV